MGDPAFSRAPRCAQVERTRQCSCEAGFQLSGVAGDSVCQGRWAARGEGAQGQGGGEKGSHS